MSGNRHALFCYNNIKRKHRSVLFSEYCYFCNENKIFAMNILKNITILALLLVVMSAFTLRKKKDDLKPVYVMGTSFCFGDSIIYFTDIQKIDSVRLTKEGFLPSREGYSDQLRSYLEFNDGNQNHTCITYFSEKKATLQKIATKLLKNYQNGTAIIRHITPGEFSYSRPEE